MSTTTLFENETKGHLKIIVLMGALFLGLRKQEKKSQKIA